MNIKNIFHITAAAFITGCATVKTPETSALFEKRVDPESGVVAYKLRTGIISENQQSAYFTFDSMTADGRFLLVMTSNNEFTNPKVSNGMALVDFKQDKIFDLKIRRTIPWLDVNTAQLWYIRKGPDGSYKGSAICRRDLRIDPLKDIVETPIPEEIFAKGKEVKYLSTHITLTKNRRKAFIAFNIDDIYEQGMVDFDTGKFESWGTCPFYANHDQLNPADDTLAMVAWEDCWITQDALDFQKKTGWYPRIWLCRPDGTRTLQPSRIINNATHERWAADGKGFYFCAPGPEGGSGVIYQDLKTGNQECVCPKKCLHASMTADLKYVAFDCGRKSQKFYRGRPYEIGFWNRATRRGVLVQSPGEALTTPDKPSKLHPDGHPTFVCGDRYIVWTILNSDGHMDLALAPVKPLIERTSNPKKDDKAVFTAELKGRKEVWP